MNADSLIYGLYGLILVVAGVGLLFVKLGPESYKKDNERYGPLSNINMGMAYTMIKRNKVKNIISLVLISIGAMLIIYAMQQE